MDPSDLTIGDLLDARAGRQEKPLVFRYDGRPVKLGYHVTEVKGRPDLGRWIAAPTRNPGRRFLCSYGTSTKVGRPTWRPASSLPLSARWPTVWLSTSRPS